MTDPLEMATFSNNSNSLEVFDTFKHPEDKDSDEESFHEDFSLQIEDDDTEMSKSKKR